MEEKVTFEQLVKVGCGLDVHKDNIVDTIRRSDQTLETREFDAYTSSLTELRDWCKAEEVTHKPLFGKDGAFAPMLKEFLEEALEAEMDGHLASYESGREAGNKRNGKGRKTVKSSQGEVEIETPQDRQSSFQPQVIEKRPGKPSPKIQAL